MIQYKPHDWQPISVGEYDTLLRCSKCGAECMESMDNSDSCRPAYGCPVLSEPHEEDEG